MPTSFQLRLASLLLLFALFYLPFSGEAQQNPYLETAYPEGYQLVFPKLIPYREGTLWGYADKTGAIKIKPQYTMAEPFEKGRAIVHKGETANLIDETGKTLLNWQHRQMYIWNNRLVIAETTSRQKGVYNINGTEILPPIYREATLLKRGDLVSPALIVAWTEQPPVPGPGGFSTTGPIQTFGLFTEEGKTVLQVIYHDIQYIRAGIIKTYKDRAFFYFDEKGNPLPAFEGYNLGTFSKGVAVISKDHKFGVADSTGKIIVQPQYDDAKEFREGKVPVKSNGSWAFLDRTGKLLTPFKYAEPGFFMKGFAIMQTGRNGYGIIDSLGQEITPFTYSYIYGALPGKLYAFNSNNVVRYGFRAKDSGKIELLEDVSGIKYFNEGWAVAIKNGKKGFIDENGKTVVPFEYMEAQGLVNGLAAVHNGKGWGVINKKQEIVIPFIYESIEVINPDRFVVWIFNRPAWGLKAIMNAKGQEIAPLKYTYINSLELDRLMVQTDNKWGIIDINGRELVKPIALPSGYEASGGLKNGIQLVINKKANKIGYADWTGRIYFKD